MDPVSKNVADPKHWLVIIRLMNNKEKVSHLDLSSLGSRLISLAPLRSSPRSRLSSLRSPLGSRWESERWRSSRDSLRSLGSGLESRRSGDLLPLLEWFSLKGLSLLFQTTFHLKRIKHDSAQYPFNNYKSDQKFGRYSGFSLWKSVLLWQFPLFIT